MEHSSTTSAGEVAFIPADGRIVLDASLLKGLRKARGVSQEALAELCFQRQMSVSIASIKRAETGRAVLYRTARHLAAVFGVQLDAISATAVAPSVITTALPAQESPALPGTDAEADRHVVQLHVALLRTNGEELEQLLQQFGGVFGGVYGGGTDADYALIHFGLPQAYTSDVERGLLCALALYDKALVRSGHVTCLRLVRWIDGRPVHAPAYAVPAATQSRGVKPVLVARNLVAQLAARFDFAPVTAQQHFLECLQLRPVTAEMPHSLCGRLIETQQFKGVVEVTQEYQDSHIVYVRGMAGMGKTRLLAEFADIARQSDFAVHRADVLDFGMDNWFAPLGQLVRSVLDLAPASATPTNWEQLLQPLPIECAIFLPLLAGAPLPPEKLEIYAAMNQAARLQSVVKALRALLLHASLQRPMLICVEDLQWGDANLFEALGNLLACTDDAPIVWVLSSRPEGDPLESSLRPAFSNPLTLMELGGIRQREAHALAEEFSEVTPEHRHRCIERAQGNPLYLTQLLSDPAHTLPDSLRHLIQARMDRLPAQHQRALRVAAVMGNRFDLDLLREALEQPQYLPDKAQHLVREMEKGRYGFVHDLVMHCIYDAIPTGLRQKLHLQVAQVYSKRNLALFAQHLLRGNDPAAFDALLAAMWEKLRLYQYDGVIELAQQCEDFSEQATGSFTLAFLRGKAHAGLGATALARAHLQQALQLARQPDEKLEAVLALAPVLNMLDLLDAEEQLLEMAVPLAQELHNDAALARLFQLQGNIWFPRGDYARCRSYHEAGLRHAHLAGDVEAEARATSGVGDSHYAEGDMQSACDVYDRCIHLGKKHGLVNVEGSNLSARSSAAFYLGRPQQAMYDAIDGLHCSQRAGDRRAEIFSRVTSSWVLLAGGKSVEAQQHLALALALAQGTGATRFEAIIREGLARVALQANDQPAAEQHIAEAAALVEKQRLHTFVGPWVYGTLALIATTDAARHEALQRGQQLLDQGALAHNLLRFYVAAAEASLLAGETERALALCDRMQASAHAGSGVWVNQHAQILVSAAAWIQAPTGEARRSLRAAVGNASAMGYAMTLPRLRHLESTADNAEGSAPTTR